jgi:hypothetical protein
MMGTALQRTQLAAAGHQFNPFVAAAADQGGRERHGSRGTGRIIDPGAAL